MDKRFLGILAAIIIVLGGIFVVSSRNSDSTNSSAEPTSHIKGKGKTGVTLLEYGDYECSVCEAYEPTVSQVANKYADKIYFQFRNLPLYPNPHPFALTAARAAEAASLQGKFWQMHDALYEANNWQAWTTSSDPTPYFDRYAQNLKLNLSQFKQDFASSKVNETIQADVNDFLGTSFANHDVTKKATPSFFLDGQYIDNSQLLDNGQPSLAKFSTLIDQAIADKQKG